MTYLVDPKGKWWRWPSEALSEQLGYPDADFDLSGYAVRNLGYISLVVQENVTLLQFRAGMISAAALASLKPFLAKAVGKAPVGIVFYASGWLEEAHLTADTLLPRMDELAVLREPRMRDQFIRRPYTPSEWHYDAHKELSGLFELWRFVDGVYSAPIERYLQTTGLIDRTVHVQPGSDEQLRFTNSGGGFTVYDTFSFDSCVGQLLTDQPDVAYGQWINSTYQNCLRSGQPVIDDVDAIIDEPGHDPRRRRYQRIILRWKRPNGEVLVTGSSLVNASIVIPLDTDRFNNGP